MFLPIHLTIPTALLWIVVGCFLAHGVWLGHHVFWAAIAVHVVMGITGALCVFKLTTENERSRMFMRLFSVISSDPGLDASKLPRPPLEVDDP